MLHQQQQQQHLDSYNDAESAQQSRRQKSITAGMFDGN